MPEKHDEQRALIIQDFEDAIFNSSHDLCQQLLVRYSKSAAEHHRHLCAIAAVARSSILSESLPLTPAAYFAASISIMSEAVLDSTSSAALLSFMSITITLVSSGSITPGKAADAVSVIVNFIRSSGAACSTSASTTRAAVKCVGVLLGFCGLESWDSIRPGFDMLLSFLNDKRPKVRKCAQSFIVNMFSSFNSSLVIKKATKLLRSLLKNYMPTAVLLKGSITLDVLEDEHMEVVHFLNLLKLTVPYITLKDGSTILSDVVGLLTSHFSVLTRHILPIIHWFLKNSSSEVIIREVETILYCLLSYVASMENPVDTVIDAATSLKLAVDKVRLMAFDIWSKNVGLVCRSLVGLLTSEVNAPSQISHILEDLINTHMDEKSTLYSERKFDEPEMVLAITSVCTVFENVLSTSVGSHDENILSIISLLFTRLGESSSFFMEAIVHKLASMMNSTSENEPIINNLEECFGCALVVIGPERILELVPLSFVADEKRMTNFWLVNILKKNVVGASLGYYIEHILPLERAIRKSLREVKDISVREYLQYCARDILELLPSFCRYSDDIARRFNQVVKIFINYLNEKDSCMHGAVSVSLKGLVDQNRWVLKHGGSIGDLHTYARQDSVLGLKGLTSLSKTDARRAIKALASCSTELLQALTNTFLDSVSTEHSVLKDAVGCLAAISESSIIKNIFLSSVTKFHLSTAVDGFTCTIHKKDSNMKNTDQHRCLLMELACSFVEGANEDLTDIIYSHVKHVLQADSNIGKYEAYCTLSRILELHPWFCSSRFDELVQMLMHLKPATEAMLAESRFANFKFLLLHALQACKDEMDDTQSFLLLNEVVLTSKNNKEPLRKAAFDVLLKLYSNLKSSAMDSGGAPERKLIIMLISYLSHSSPQMKSGAVSILSVLVHEDPNVCVSVPNMLPSVLLLLQTRDVEVVKAALGFMKVLVLRSKSETLISFIYPVTNAILPWSRVSRNHFRAKVKVILQIMVRKCGFAIIESAAGDGHKGFVKTLLENRNGRPQSGDAGAPRVKKHHSKSCSLYDKSRLSKDSSVTGHEENLRKRSFAKRIRAGGRTVKAVGFKRLKGVER